MIKNKKIMKILTAIVLLISLMFSFVNVEASSTNVMMNETVKVEDFNMGTDVSGELPMGVRVVKTMKPLLTKIMFILGIVSLIYGIKLLVKNKQKRGIIFILLFIVALLVVFVLDVAIHDHTVILY